MKMFDKLMFLLGIKMMAEKVGCTKKINRVVNVLTVKEYL